MRNRWLLIGLGLALLVAILSPLASAHPDGLERVAEDAGFEGAAREAPFAVIADYVFPGVQNEALATILAGVLGTLVTFGLLWGLGRLVVRRRPAA